MQRRNTGPGLYIVTREEHAANPWLPPAYLDGWPCSWLSTEDDNVTPSAWLQKACPARAQGHDVIHALERTGVAGRV